MACDAWSSDIMNRMFGLVCASAPNARLARGGEANSGSASISRRVIDFTRFPLFPVRTAWPAKLPDQLETELLVARCIRTGDLTECRGTQRSARSSESGRIREM